MAKHKYIESPEQLWDYFLQYIEHNRANPYTEQQWVGKDGHEVHKQIMAHISFDGFEGWLCENDVINDLGDYASDKDGRYTEYATIITRIRRVCRGRLLTAAVSGVANGNVVSRYLGIAEKTENDNKNTNYEVTLNLDASKSNQVQ